jgi:transcriptional antiterminator RfaH
MARAHWYALYTKPHRELGVQRFLLSRGIETYLPTLIERSKGSPRREQQRPFFSCYLFAHLDLSTMAVSWVNSSPGVHRVVSFGDQPVVVPDQVLQYLQQRLARVDSRDYYRGLPLRPGDRLRVTKGPLKGMEAIFDQRLSSGDRARVLVEMLGRLTACQVDLCNLERVRQDSRVRSDE